MSTQSYAAEVRGIDCDRSQTGQRRWRTRLVIKAASLAQRLASAVLTNLVGYSAEQIAAFGWLAKDIYRLKRPMFEVEPNGKGEGT